MDYFSCFMCMEDLEDPHFCPKCSKLGCKKCLENWLNSGHNQCPHCRATLYSTDLIACRWLKEIAKEFQSLLSENENLKCQLEVIGNESNNKKRKRTTRHRNGNLLQRKVEEISETEQSNRAERILQRKNCFGRARKSLVLSKKVAIGTRNFIIREEKPGSKQIKGDSTMIKATLISIGILSEKLIVFYLEIHQLVSQ